MYTIILHTYSIDLVYYIQYIHTGGDRVSASGQDRLATSREHNSVPGCPAHDSSSAQ